jgi:serine/threonine protein phosphatase PrpC
VKNVRSFVADHPTNPGRPPSMSSVESLPQTLPIPSLDVPVAPKRRRILGAVLAEAEMADVAAFEFAGGTAAVFTTRSPGKTSPNEDVAALLPISAEAGILAVADGLGGHVGGERASRLAIETIRAGLLNSLASLAASNRDQIRGTILNGIEAANRAVMALGTGAATTLALIEVQGRTIRPYHVGDSVILLTGQRGKIKMQTIAHSPVGYAVEAGLLNEEEAMRHEERHVISNVIGSSQMRIEIGPAIDMAPRDTLILASDGLVDNLLPEEVVSFVRSGPLDESLRAMVEEAQRRMSATSGEAPSKPDDLTAIIYRPV